MAKNPTHEEINQKEMLPKASSAQWQTIFDAINDAVCLLDMNGKILRCNKAMESLLKKSSKEIIGGICWELMYGTDKPIKSCPIVRMKKTLRRESLVLKVDDDKWLNVAVDPLIDETGNLAGAVHIISDITRRKQAEEALRESEEKYRSLTDQVEKKMKEMQAQLRQSRKIEDSGTLASGVAHKLNNLLTVIMGNAELALMNVIKDESLRRKIEEIKEAGEKATSLTRQLTARFFSI